MIVALETAHGGGEERLAHGIDDIVEVLLTGFFDFDHGGIPGAHTEEGAGDEVFAFLFAVVTFGPKVFVLLFIANSFAEGVVGEFVAGDLLHHEFVVGLVLVEGANDVITITPHVGAFEVVGKTTGVGVAGDVEPMLAPTFAVVG